MNKEDDAMLYRALDNETTVRDKWRCFYRLYRMASKKGDPFQDAGVLLCLRILLPKTSPRLLGLLSEDVRSPKGRSTYPTFIRKKLLDLERRRRLHGKHYEFLERDQAVARMLAETGKEMTPEEVAETRIVIAKKLRAYALERGWELPSDDLQLFEYLRRLRNASN